MLKFLFIIAIVSGFLNGLYELYRVQNNPSLGIKPSKNLFTFLFMDRY